MNYKPIKPKITKYGTVTITDKKIYISNFDAQGMDLVELKKRAIAWAHKRLKTSK